MSDLRYLLENKYAELGSDAPDLRRELLEFFESDIRPKFDMHDQLYRPQDDQTVYHVCYDCNMQLWRQIYNRVKAIADECGLQINWEQIKHVIKFTFISTPPGGCFQPHINYNLLAGSAFNIPLQGTTFINLYDNETKEEVARHEYINPSILNTNGYHAVYNDCPTERIMLKTHLSVTPFVDIVEAYQNDTKWELFPGRDIGWEGDNIRKW